MSKSAAVDSVTTWVLRLSRDGHIGSSPGLRGVVYLCARDVTIATPRARGLSVLISNGYVSAAGDYSCGPSDDLWEWGVGNLTCAGIKSLLGLSPNHNGSKYGFDYR